MARPYRITFGATARTQLKKLDKSVQLAIIDVINQKLTWEPASMSQPLRYQLKGHRKLRVGDYRIIFTLHEEEILVLVVGIGHRRDIYGG